MSDQANKPRKYVPRLVKGTEDHYTIHTDNFGTMLCYDQLDQEFVKIEAYESLQSQLAEAQAENLKYREEMDKITNGIPSEWAYAILRKERDVLKAENFKLKEQVSMSARLASKDQATIDSLKAEVEKLKVKYHDASVEIDRKREIILKHIEAEKILREGLEKAKQEYWNKCYDGSGNVKALNLAEFDRLIDRIIAQDDAVAPRWEPKPSALTDEDMAMLAELEKPDAVKEGE